MGETTPPIRLVLSFDIRPGMQQVYYQFMISQFVPAIQRMGLQMVDAWQTVYGDYPGRTTSFVGLNLENLRQVMADNEWIELEERLREYIENYSWKVIQLRDGFQL